MVKPLATLPAVRPNAGLTQLYKRRLLRLLDDMHRSVAYWVQAAYRANEPKVVALAEDATPADIMSKVIEELKSRWFLRFEKGAEELAAYFAQSAYKRSDKQLQAILKRAGFSVEFKLTAAQKDIVAASINENVALIKSIPEQYFKNIEGSVMRSVATGRDVGGLAKELQATYGVSRRRAQLISLDQNNKVTASLQRARQIEIGCEEAIWMHSHGGKTPRPSHVANDRKRYNVKDGWFDPDEKKVCWPGTLVNCRCTSKPIIPGLIL